MTTLSDKDYIRKVRRGNGEFYISISKEFLKQKGLNVGDNIDLRIFEVVRNEKPDK